MAKYGVPVFVGGVNYGEIHIESPNGIVRKRALKNALQRLLKGNVRIETTASVHSETVNLNTATATTKTVFVFAVGKAVHPISFGITSIK